MMRYGAMYSLTEWMEIAIGSLFFNAYLYEVGLG